MQSELRILMIRMHSFYSVETYFFDMVSSHSLSSNLTPSMLIERAHDSFP